MDRLTRIVGIGLLLGAVVYSVTSFQQTVKAASPAEEDQELVLPIEAERRTAIEASEAEAAAQVATQVTAEAATGADAPPPLLLGFVEGYRPGRYTIEYAPAAASVSNSDEDSPASTTGTTGTGDLVELDANGDGVASADEVVPGTMPPGLYATGFGVENCSYEIRRMVSTRRSAPATEQLIGEDYLLDGRLLVSFNKIEPDVFTSMPACGDWVPWSPLVQPLTVADDGDYWVGDLAEGTWSVPVRCVWEKVVAFRGAELVDVDESGVGPQPLVVDDQTLGVRIRGCAEPMELLAG